MACVHRINTGDDVVNGLVVLQPAQSGQTKTYDGHAQVIPSGHDPAHWSMLDSRYINDPSGWSE